MFLAPGVSNGRSQDEQGSWERTERSRASSKPSLGAKSHTPRSQFSPLIQRNIYPNALFPDEEKLSPTVD